MKRTTIIFNTKHREGTAMIFQKTVNTYADE
jgi:hypothetical protein